MADVAMLRPPSAERHTEGRGEVAHPARRAYVGVLVVGVVVTSVLTWSVWLAHDRNEGRLLEQRTREAAAVLATALTSIQTPLASAAELAEGNDGNVESFKRLATPLVDRRQFVSVSLWQVDGSAPLVVVGEPPALGLADQDRVRTELERARSTPLLTVVDFLDQPQPRLGYSYTSQQPPVRYLAYAEVSLTPNRLQQNRPGQAFDGLDYAVYLGEDERAESLLTTNVAGADLKGRRATGTVPFGDTKLLLVMRPSGHLGGRLMAILPWITAATGALLSGLAAALAGHLARRRHEAEVHSAQNRRLFEVERDIATTVQRSLLPLHLPDVPGCALAARYATGEPGVQVGGDWYDVMQLDGSHVLFVVGDVSGRGLAASATMASLRFTTRAYALEGHAPATILSKLAKLLEVGRDGHFATVLCGIVDVTQHEVTFASAGHPGPMLVVDGGAQVMQVPVGVPVGVRNPATYEQTTMSVAAGAILIGFTDGLYERRGESIDVGLDRIRNLAAASSPVLEVLLDELLAEVGTGSKDDTALVGLQWLN